MTVRDLIQHMFLIATAGVIIGSVFDLDTLQTGAIIYAGLVFGYIIDSHHL